VCDPAICHRASSSTDAKFAEALASVAAFTEVPLAASVFDAA
jgi:hypothetical protein